MKALDNFVIRGSSSGVFRNNEFISATDVACPRKTILRHLKIEETVNPKTQAIFKIGHYFEEYFKTLHPELEAETLVTGDGWEGHADFTSSDHVWELKSVTSKNTYNQVFKKGLPKEQAVIQLASYMLQLEISTGTLVFGSFCHIATYDKLMKMKLHEIAPLFENAVPEMKEFAVEINEDGGVLLDGVSFMGLHVSELMEFQAQLHELVKNDVLPPRVEALKPDAWSDPCKFCKLAMLCDSSPVSLEDFAADAADVFAGLAEEI